MLALGRILCLIACLGAAAPGLAQEKAPPDKASELELARELIAQREKLDRMKADPWGQAWQGMKDFLRDKLRGWLDDAPSAPPETTRT
jgi:hypothetical protein